MKNFICWDIRYYSVKKKDVRVPRCGKTSRVWSKIKARVFGLGEKYEEATL